MHRGGNVAQSSATRLAWVLPDRDQQPKVDTTGPLRTKTAAAMGTVTARGTRALGWAGVRAVAGPKRTGVLLPTGKVRSETLNAPSEGWRSARCGKTARPVCAVRRSVVSLVQPGRTWRSVLGSNGLPKAERSMGTTACQQSSDPPEGVDGDALLDPHDMVKATLLEVQSPDGECAHPSVQRLQSMSRSASA